MKNRKIFIILILFMGLSLILCSCVCAETYDFNFHRLDGADSGDTGNVIYTIFGNVINIVTLIGVGIALVILIVLGIKYVVGSVEAKAEIKKTAPTYVMGAVIIFAASAILQLVYIIITGISSSIKV